jgi:hypothetical protein
MFTNEEIILENAIKRKDTLKMKAVIEFEPQTKIVNTINLLGSTLVKLDEKKVI